MNLSKQEVAYMRQTMNAMLEELEYKPEITMAEHELAAEVRECLTILSESEDSDDDVEELDFSH